MNSVQAPIETYACEMCGYYQNIDPFTPGLMAQMFPEFPGISDGLCPACYSGRNGDGVKRSTQLSRLVDSMPTTINVASDSHLESQTVEELDEHGQPIMIQTGERYELRVNQQTGAVYSEAVPVYEPKMRELTAQEIADLKTQRDDSLRNLEKIAA